MRKIQPDRPSLLVLLLLSDSELDAPAVVVATSLRAAAATAGVGDGANAGAVPPPTLTGVAPCTCDRLLGGAGDAGAGDGSGASDASTTCDMSGEVDGACDPLGAAVAGVVAASVVAWSATFGAAPDIILSISFESDWPPMLEATAPFTAGTLPAPDVGAGPGPGVGAGDGAG